MVVDPNSDIWKICALCRHCRTVEQGREIPELQDSEYIVFHCDYYNVQTREDYLMIPTPETLPEVKPRVCPHWEPVPEGE